MTDEPRQLADTGGNDGVRDPRTGRFVAGHPGFGGRPRGPNFRTIVEQAEGGEEGVGKALARVYKALLAAAEKGDTSAAKLLLDRIPVDDMPARHSVVLELLTGVPQTEEDE